MQNLSTEPQTFDSIQAINTKEPSIFKGNLLCPQCKMKVPLITGISITKKIEPSIELICRCSSLIPPRKYKLSDYLQFLSTQKQSTLCFNHNDQFAIVFCKFCSIHMCQICYSYHSLFMPSHEIQGLQVNTKNKDNDKSTTDNQCHIHPNHSLDFYCEECYEAICIKCSSEHEQHFNHHIIQLNDYWEKTKNGLPISSIDQLHSFFSNQTQLFNSMIQSQLDKIEVLIINLKLIKEKLENASRLVKESNKVIESFASLLLTQFYKGQMAPNYNIIKNVERINFNNIIIKKEEGEAFVRIYNQINELMNVLNIANRNIIFKTLIQMKKDDIKQISLIKAIKENVVLNNIDIQPQGQFNAQPQPHIQAQSQIEPKLFNNIEQKEINQPNNNINLSQYGKSMNKEDILKALNIDLDDNDKSSINHSEQSSQKKHSQFLNKKKPRVKNDSIQPISKKGKGNKKSNKEEDLVIRLPLNMSNWTDETPIDKPVEETGVIDDDNNLSLNLSLNDNQSTSKPNVLNSLNDSLTNMFYDDNRSKFNFNQNQTISEGQLNCENDLDFFNSIFSNINETNKPIPPREDISQSNNSTSISFSKYEKCIRTLSEHKDKINVIAQLSNGLLVSGGKDSLLNFYDEANDYECISTISTNKNEIISLTELCDRNIAVGCMDNSIKIYDVVNQQCISLLIGHSSPVTSIDQKDHDTLISVSEDQTIKLWSLQSFTCIKTYEEHTKNLIGVIVFNESIFITASSDFSLKLWDFDQSKSLHTIQVHRAPISKVIKIDNERIASSSYDRTIKIWEVNKVKCYGTLIGHSDKVTSILKLNDVNTLASASFDCSIKIWDINRILCKKTITITNYQIRDIILLSKGAIASISEDGNVIKIWE